MVVDVGSILPSRWWCASELQLSCIWSLMLMLVGSVASERTGMVMCPLLHLSFKAGLLAWSSILQWNVLVVLTTYMPEGSGAGWGPAGRMGKLIPGTHIISHQDEFLLLTGWKRLRVINLLSSSCLISGGWCVRPPCWPLFLTGWTLSNSHSYIKPSRERNHAAGRHHFNDGSMVVDYRLVYVIWSIWLFSFSRWLQSNGHCHTTQCCDNHL